MRPRARRAWQRPRNWKTWQLPPDNDDWWGFVNLLGTREVAKKKQPAGPDGIEDDVENEPGFPWKGIGIGNTGSNPPPESAMKNYIGQSPSCMFPPVKGNGTDWYIRWYYDPRSGVCKRFIYSGSGGNVNKFLTEYHCNQTCNTPARVSCVPDKLFDYLKYLQTPDMEVA
ncbi:unnamed protein product, partial [Iphiclides podalirius]